MINVNISDRGFYSSKTAARISRVKYQSFQAWAKASLLHASFHVIKGKKTENIYSYYDLLLIRVIKRLREKGFSIKKIKTALNVIKTMMNNDPYGWTQATIAIDADMIVVFLPEKKEWNPIAASKGEQKMEVVFFPELIDELKHELVPSRFRFVEVDPMVLAGTPTIKGTRIPTSVVYNLSKEGIDAREAYPGLSEEQIDDAKKFEEFLVAG